MSPGDSTILGPTGEIQISRLDLPRGLAPAAIWTVRFPWPGSPHMRIEFMRISSDESPVPPGLPPDVEAEILAIARGIARVSGGGS